MLRAGFVGSGFWQLPDSYNKGGTGILQQGLRKLFALFFSSSFGF